MVRIEIFENEERICELLFVCREYLNHWEFCKSYDYSKYQPERSEEVS